MRTRPPLRFPVRMVRMHCSAAPSLRRAPQDYENRKNALIRLERDMLRAFGFIVHVEHPHKLVLNHLHVMGATALHQEAWSLANDR